LSSGPYRSFDISSRYPFSGVVEDDVRRVVAAVLHVVVGTNAVAIEEVETSTRATVDLEKFIVANYVEVEFLGMRAVQLSADCNLIIYGYLSRVISIIGD
jgi:hypothetical protein